MKLQAIRNEEREQDYQKMTDIFSNTILCGKCNVKMKPVEIHRNGFFLRAVICPKCSSRIMHPKDEQDYGNFMDLKKKEFNVKMRFVGNSYAVSIPKEIVNFIKEQEKIMDEMVKLSLEEFGRISLSFGCNSNNPADRIRELKEKHKEVNLK